MTNAIKCCFKYAQDRVREQYTDYLVHEQKKNIAQKIKEHRSKLLSMRPQVSKEEQRKKRASKALEELNFGSK